MVGNAIDTNSCHGSAAVVVDSVDKDEFPGDHDPRIYWWLPMRGFSHHDVTTWLTASAVPFFDDDGDYDPLIQSRFMAIMMISLLNSSIFIGTDEEQDPVASSLSSSLGRHSDILWP